MPALSLPERRRGRRTPQLSTTPRKSVRFVASETRFSGRGARRAPASALEGARHAPLPILWTLNSGDLYLGDVRHVIHARTLPRTCVSAFSTRGVSLASMEWALASIAVQQGDRCERSPPRTIPKDSSGRRAPDRFTTPAACARRRARASPRRCPRRGLRSARGRS